jgi:WD40 repeat protein
MSSETDDAQKNPFPGLRPFREDEEHLFFGREKQVDAMVNKLAATRFLAVVGASGSGKSSLVNCGLRPALRQGLMAHAGTAWRIAQFRPGNDPIGAMARALAQEGVLFREYAAAGLSLAEIVESSLRLSKLGLIDIVEQARLDPGVNLLLVADQFEELFRYRQAPHSGHGDARHVSEDATAFVNLLLEVKAQTNCAIYIVLTMRSDFLGDCTQFPGLAEAINAGQYLVPRMTRDERRAAIAGPAMVGGADISPVLLTRLVNDVGDNPDQLSILQHALNRTWARWQSADGGTGPLGLAHYEAIGTMAQALDQHAERTYAELGDTRRQWICEKLLKALTDKATDPRGVRRPTTLSTLCALTGATAAEVTGVIEVFRKPSRSFLVPPAGEVLEANTVIDISHESLMRVWQRLNTWADEEARSASLYRRLAETAAMYAAGRVSLWRDPELQLALDWRDANRPNQAWAACYDAGLAQAMDFLDRSLDARQAQQAAEQARQQREHEILQQLAAESAKSVRRLRIGFAVAAVLAVVATGTAFRAHKLGGIAEQQSVLADSRRLAALSTSRLSDQLDLALLLGVQASAMAATREAEISLSRALLYNPPLRVFLHQQTSTRSVAYSPDGARLAVANNDGAIVLVDLQSGASRTLAAHQAGVNSVVFSPDSAQLATASDDGTIRVWDVASGLARHTLTGHQGAVNSVAFSPDGAQLASAGFDHKVILWHANTGRTLRILAGHRNRVRSIAFSPDGKRLASGSHDATVRLWEVSSGEARILSTKQQGVNSVAFSPDGARLASGGDDNTVKLWDVEKGQLQQTLTEHKDNVNSVAFSRDGARLASASDDRSIILWDAGTGLPLRILSGHHSQVDTVAFHPDSAALASGGHDGKIILWDARGTAGLQILKGHANSVTSVARSADGKRLASGSTDNTIIVWDAKTGEALRTLDGHTGSVRSVAFSPDGTRLASGSDDDTVRLWEIDSGKVLQTLARHRNTVNTVAFSPDGTRLASGGIDGAIVVWDVASYKIILTLTGHQDAVNSVSFSLDSVRLASGGDDNTVRLWDLASGQLRQTLTEHRDNVHSVAFSPDGTRLASGSDDARVILWDSKSGNVLQTLQGHEQSVNSVTFSPDGAWLASGSRDRRILLWNATSGDALPLLEGQKDAVNALAFSPDGARLISGGDDGKVLLQDVKGREVALSSPRDRACRIANRNLSAKEWREYIGRDVPYRRTCPTLPPGEGA